MPIQFGSSNISDIYFGGGIKEVYYGSTKVWSKTQPESYIPLQYVIIPNGSQGDFLTDYDPTTAASGSYVCEFKVRPDGDAVGTGVGAGFCQGVDNFGAGIGQAYWEGTKWVLFGNGWATLSVNVTASTSTDAVLALAINPSSSSQFAKISANGTTAAWAKSNFAVDHWGHFHIDGASPDASIAGNSTLSGRWYYVKETVGGELVHNYIPARNDDSSKVGFYDTVTNQWVLCSAGSAWIEGPDANGLLMSPSGPSLTQQLLDEMSSDND